jgi:hypothetical protein
MFERSEDEVRGRAHNLQGPQPSEASHSRKFSISPSAFNPLHLSTNAILPPR